MQDRKLIKKLLIESKIIQDNGKVSRTRDKILSNNNELFLLIIESTNYLDRNATSSERIYHIINDLYCVQKCKQCNKKLSYDYKRLNTGKGYKLYCDLKCKTEYEVQNDIMKQRAEKMVKTRSKIDENGLTSYKKGAIKARQTKYNDINEDGLNNYEFASRKAAKTMMAKIDKETGISISKTIGMKIKEKRMKKNKDGLNNYQYTALKMQNKRRKTNEKNGTWIPLDELNDFERYAYQVWKVTNSQLIQKLDNYHLRGRNSYHLDHIFSIFEGFKNNVAPYIVGNVCNLRFIPESINCSKNKRCDITIDELFERYQNKKE